MFSELKQGCTTAKKVEFAKYQEDGLNKVRKHPQFAALKGALSSVSANYQAACACMAWARPIS